jgi:hypothetical protein
MMFDPTIFDNLKVVLEGAVYDLDLTGIIFVTNRIDQVDLAAMSRRYAIEFREKDTARGETRAEISLLASIQDLAGEMIPKEKDSPSGCLLEIRFYRKIKDMEKECILIHKRLEQIWEDRPNVKQTISFVYGEPRINYRHEILLDFGRKINEAQMEDIPTLVDHTVHSIQSLNDLETFFES